MQKPSCECEHFSMCYSVVVTNVTQLHDYCGAINGNGIRIRSAITRSRSLNLLQLAGEHSSPAAKYNLIKYNLSISKPFCDKT